MRIWKLIGDDFSPECVHEILVERYGQHKASALSEYRYKMIKYAGYFALRVEFNNTHSVWKPLAGPVKDWPLALCQRSSVNTGTDYEMTDDVHAGEVDESIQLHYNESQRWFYLGDQMPNEALVFLTSDSELGIAAGRSLPESFWHTSIKSASHFIVLTCLQGVPHCGFQNRNCPPGVKPRQSIEVRCFVFQTDEDLALDNVLPSRRHGAQSMYHT